jgi:hypothetical protein
MVGSKRRFDPFPEPTSPGNRIDFGTGSCRVIRSETCFSDCDESDECDENDGSDECDDCVDCDVCDAERSSVNV